MYSAKTEKMTNGFYKPPSMSHNIVVIDVETTGFPARKGYDQYFDPKEVDNYETSRVIEIAYAVCTFNGNIIKKYNSLVIPDGFKIENSHIHGITQEDAKENGKSIREVLLQLSDDLDGVITIVSHNINFDKNIIQSECHRLGLGEIADKIDKKNKECTMLIGKGYMRSDKSPKLTELYRHLFSNEIVQEHRAMSDVMICLECYFEMIANQH